MIKVYLVAGGYGEDNKLRVSTEILIHGESSWKVVAALPHAMSGLRIVSVDNQIISTGEYLYYYHFFENPCTHDSLNPWGLTVSFGPTQSFFPVGKTFSHRT